jgi:hypothetical protein
MFHACRRHPSPPSSLLLPRVSALSLRQPAVLSASTAVCMTGAPAPTRRATPSLSLLSVSPVALLPHHYRGRGDPKGRRRPRVPRAAFCSRRTRGCLASGRPSWGRRDKGIVGGEVASLLNPPCSLLSDPAARPQVSKRPQAAGSRRFRLRVIAAPGGCPSLCRILLPFTCPAS